MTIPKGWLGTPSATRVLDRLLAEDAMKPTDRCDGFCDGCTVQATTTRDMSGGNRPRVPYCAPCAAEVDRWLHNYCGPADSGEGRSDRDQDRDALREAGRMR